MKSNEFDRIQTVRPKDHDLTINDDDVKFTCQPCVADDVITELGQGDLVCGIDEDANEETEEDREV